MANKRRQFTAEFRLEAVRMANDSGKPVSQTARKHSSLGYQGPAEFERQLALTERAA